MLYGVDVSSYQRPEEIPEGVDFVIVRATYGTRHDRRAREHVQRARDLGARVGLYHFFLPTRTVQEQLSALGEVMAACDIGAGDIVPMIDVERYPAAPGAWAEPTPAWAPDLEALIADVAEVHGGCGVYVTQRDWRLLGSPAWLLAVPQWVAHWRTTEGPVATPGGDPWEIHQYRVGPYREGALHVLSEATARDAIDHDRAEALPLLPGPEAPARYARTLPDRGPIVHVDWDEWRRSRDALIRERTAAEADAIEAIEMADGRGMRRHLV